MTDAISLFRLPGEVHFGWGASRSIEHLVRQLGTSRIALVTDPGVIAAGITEPIAMRLRDAGYPVCVISAVSPNPRDHEVLSAVEAIVEDGSDIVVSVGGGSPIDLAKAAAGIATNGGTPQDWPAPAFFPNQPLPHIAVPTTAGTGSEVTRSAVINDTERAIKISLRDSRIAPRFAVVDPELTMALPPLLTASTGMDALTHAIEAYTCRRATIITDALALHAMRLIAEHLVTAVEDGSNREARHGMMMASVIAGMAFSNADVAAVHCIAEAIGGRYDTPHGVANSLFLPYLFAFNAEAHPARHADVAVALGAAHPPDDEMTAARKGAEALTALATRIGIPALRAIPGIRPDDFPWIAAAAAANLSNSSNARQMTESDYLGVLDAAWNAAATS